MILEETDDPYFQLGYYRQKCHDLEDELGSLRETGTRVILGLQDRIKDIRKELRAAWDEGYQIGKAGLNIQESWALSETIKK